MRDFAFATILAVSQPEVIAFRSTQTVLTYPHLWRGKDREAS
jgi:hypothetical protein